MKIVKDKKVSKKNILNCLNHTGCGVDVECACTGSVSE